MFRVLGTLLCMIILTHSAYAEMAPPEDIAFLPAKVQQAVYVYNEGGDVHQASLEVWERMNGAWRMVDEMPAVVGRNGIAPEGEKREGDGRTPSGIFALERAFGYADSVDTGLEYTQVTENDFWIDDAESPDYNMWVKGEKPDVSHEVLRRDDDLYEFAAVVEYNNDPVVPDHGSAIFLHVWRAHDKPTAGCIALSRDHVQSILSRLSTGLNPFIIIRN